MRVDGLRCLDLSTRKAPHDRKERRSAKGTEKRDHQGLLIEHTTQPTDDEESDSNQAQRCVKPQRTPRKGSLAQPTQSRRKQ